MQDASAKLKKLKKSEIRKAILRISNFEDKQIPTQTPGKPGKPFPLNLFQTQILFTQLGQEIF